jgi:hypothetical protein
MFLEAKKCYVKAHSVGDVEGTALLKLAKWGVVYFLDPIFSSSERISVCVCPILVTMGDGGCRLGNISKDNFANRWLMG